jgi:hypothetical protein
MSKARQAIPTVTFVDEYCQLYHPLLSNREGGMEQVHNRDELPEASS